MRVFKTKREEYLKNLPTPKEQATILDLYIVARDTMRKQNANK